ncbi:MAG: outer membrane protein assembly factor BamA [Chthoniobacterales bacterium]
MNTGSFFAGAMRFKLILLCLLAVTANLLYGQAGAGPVVKQVDIQFAGPVSMSKERVTANLKTQPGTIYSERSIEDDISSLYATGDVSNVRIFAEPLGDGVKVNVVLTGRPTVEELHLEGITALNVNHLRKDLSSKVGETLSDERLEEDRQKILKEYQDKYFYNVDIKYRVEDLPGTNRKRVTYAVTEGPKMQVKQISFVGNDSILPKDLKKVLVTKTANILSLFTKAGRVLPGQLDDDRAAIKMLYQNRGFSDAKVTDVRIDPLAKDGVNLVFTISEGVQYHIGKVTLEGAQIVTAEQLHKQLKMTEGELYTPKGMSDDLKAVRDFYGRQGYVDLQMTPEIDPAGEGSVNIVYRVEEGVQSYVNLISIQGNTRTKDRVIRRELAIRPGDVFNSVLVDISKKRMENLNYFSKVDMVPQNTIVPGRKDLNVIVEEKRTGSFNFGVGFSTIDSLVGFAELVQTNFDLFNWPRFVGAGQRFRIRAQVGLQRNDFVASLTEPWFLGYQLSVGGEVFYHDATFLSNVYSQRNYGGALQIRKAITNFIAIRGEYRIEAVQIYDVSPPNQAGQVIQDAAGTLTKSSVMTALTYDTRDNLMLTRKGEVVELTGFFGGLGGDVKDYGLSLTGSKFFPLPWDMIFQIKGELAVVSGWGGNSVPIWDALYLGGANNLRGFAFREVGPKDEFGNPIGGNSLGYMTTEITFPIITRIRGAVFADGGFVNANAYDFSGSNFNADIGIGLRLDLPIGPIRIDYGFPVVSDSWNGGSGKVNFNVGYQF